MNWPLSVHQGSVYSLGPTLPGRNSASDAPHLLAGPMDLWRRWKSRCLPQRTLWQQCVLNARSLAMFIKFMKPYLLPRLWAAAMELTLLCTDGSADVCTWGPYCFVTPSLKYQTLWFEQPPHKHLCSCHAALPWWQPAFSPLPSLLLGRGLAEWGAMEVMLPQLTKEDGWWETGGQAQSVNFGYCRLGSLLSFKHCSDIAQCLCRYTIQHRKPRATEESPDGFFVLQHRIALFSLAVVTDAQQTLQTEQVALGLSFYRTSEHVHSQELSKASICKKNGLLGKSYWRIARKFPKLLLNSLIYLYGCVSL